MKEKPFSTSEPDLAGRIIQALEGIRFGSLEIVIHDSKIVRIERHEKIRFETDMAQSFNRVRS